MALRLQCGDQVRFDGQRWMVVAYNNSNRLAVFVRPHPLTGKDIRRCLLVGAGDELQDPVTLAVVDKLEPIGRGFDAMAGG